MHFYLSDLYQLLNIVFLFCRIALGFAIISCTVGGIGLLTIFFLLPYYSEMDARGDSSYYYNYMRNARNAQRAHYPHERPSWQVNDTGNGLDKFRSTQPSTLSEVSNAIHKRIKK